MPAQSSCLRFERLEARDTPAALVAPTAAPSDPSVGSQWGLAAINAQRGWDVATGTGRTIVAVVDTGVDLSHPDLKGNLWRNPGEIPGNGIDDDGNGYVDDVHGYDFAGNDADPTDERGHGTHVAGIIGAAGNNGIGGSGVAWRTRIMVLKIFDANGNGSTAGGAKAIEYAVRNGAKVINCSWGGSGPDTDLEFAMAQARAAGVIVVASAGNDGLNNDVTPAYPADYARTSDNTVAVAATTRSTALARWSNYGPASVAVAAPGDNVVSTARGGGTTAKSGTSMAAPFVSGALAVLWDKNPTWTYQQVLAKLKATVETQTSLAGKVTTGGELDLAKLLDAPPPTVPPAVPTTTTTLKPLTGNLSGTAVTDFRTTRATFNVTQDKTVGTVRLTVDLTHARTSDLQLRLTSPDGRKAVLFNRTAGANLAGATFSSTAFAGLRAKGTWTLEIFDVVSGATGTVRSVGLLV
jgi:subtilisin family serine protease